MTVPTECDQADGAELLLTRTEAQAHQAPLICKGLFSAKIHMLNT